MSYSHYARSGIIVKHSEQRLITRENMIFWFDSLELLSQANEELTELTQLEVVARKKWWVSRSCFKEYREYLSSQGFRREMDWSAFNDSLQNLLKSDDDMDNQLAHFNCFLTLAHGEDTPELEEFRVFKDGEYGYLEGTSPRGVPSSDELCYIFFPFQIFSKDLTIKGKVLSTLVDCELEETLWSRMG